ncbi:heat-inducible transcriptional repressor HrcA [Oharaeibacter diazotrophicus]|uniref:Heat-inducible transcription repressor HrcA n=1 Tax=Oharaeibacter diazotrophicus TaxID=1920512 RepID=A0A4R6RFI3_9HYPH|nr:heat-inducible transcriptional repressor HrcA [Oharaeibacter diazotrophicus]TDP84992.1 heat-inducible transcription repressor HrcA [Oharaeibacter diazotrophicus]BBE73961.1 heat-inducible transcription repressor HrcA [Pleomorphomonas sp. SM30]GLS76352.1 heat-inducible transcription repressor HrcA [Oharaeibacter diazotrophicus]
MAADTRTGSLRELDERSREIFRRIVDTYLETGEASGSRNISRLLAAPLSPASVRNVMADLEREGLIYAPHTSAGRLPTDLGLRFFVDAMLEFGDLTSEERSTIETKVRIDGGGRSVETVLTEASQMLSGLSRGAGVVVTPKADMRLKHIEFVRIEPTRGLVVLVGENGTVENRLIDLPPGLPPSSLVEAANFLNARIRGRTLSEIRAEIERRAAEQREELDGLTARLVEAGLASWSSAAGDRPQTLIVRGRANLLDDVRAAEDLERIRALFEDLETNADLVQLLGLADAGDGVRIFIGSENKLFGLSGSSLVVSPYRDGDARVIGVVGVIGPTRLNYARVVPMVDYTARMVGRLLG